MQPVINITAPTPPDIKPTVYGRVFRTTTFFADAVLFDMDGTLTDSIAAVEAAWGRVAREIGADTASVIAATHGKRAIDNLAHFKPHLRSHEMEAAVEEFEQSILFYADAYACRRAAGINPSSLLSDCDSDCDSGLSSGASSGFSSANNSSVSSLALPNPLASTEQLTDKLAAALSIENGDRSKEWELELEDGEVDRAVRILPGVKALLKSIPEGRYAVDEQHMAAFLEWALSRPK